MKNMRDLPEKGVYAGYWISPAGKIFGVEEDHFRFIWSHPLLFGLNKEIMQELYNKFYNEQDTIKQIIDDLLEYGWVKCLKKQKYWYVYLNILNRKTADRVWEWAYHSLNGDLANEAPYQLVKIYELYRHHTRKVTFADILTGDFVYNKTRLSAKIQKFIEQHLDYFLEEYLELEEFIHESHRY